jgi:hypothetical protein
MKSYSTIIPGKKMSQFMELPEEFQECDLKVLVKPIFKKKSRASLKTSPEADFLLSIAGIFDSKRKTTSEHVHEIVDEYVVRRHEKNGHH